ncbi:ferredoxin--NADP reductase [Pseudonocardia sp. DSM 110487]|uniref:ferredoxin--NADP reductase n=1 Tax=Pseudonocardia sp. DSM 110487 TaxID=2865833 RepID=UPI001C694E14|nr:ferredoxin--NADP reductase [Pseudonocardia sp. DSM 110487]QYN36872.1 ferredoxin--NADP reductase [Pseudonocardia sp. DSM 110487]
MADRLTVIEVVEETSDARSVVFSVPAELGERYAYRPGQFLTIRIPGSSLARCYSLSSSPHEGRIAVTVKRVTDGRGSNWICDNVTVGMELETLPPAGTFTPRSLDEDMAFFAAGSGITPVISIIRAALAQGSGRLALVYANRDERSVIFGAELRELAAAHPGRLLVQHWLESLQGLPSQAALAELARPFAPREHFVCGPAPFMDAITHALRDLGVPRKRIHIERFVSLDEDPFAATQPVEATEGTAARLAVELDGEQHAMSWPPGTKLLDLLRDAGVDAPFSCRQGSCGACACRVTGGEVKLLRNETLDRTDLDEGWVLACQALPVSDEVAVTFDS